MSKHHTYDLLRVAILALTVLALLPCATLKAQWTQTTGPYGGSVGPILVDDPYTYAGGNGGVFISSDGAETWQTANQGLTSLDVSAFDTLGEFVYAGTEGDGIFRRTRHGSNWSPVNVGLTGLHVLTLMTKGDTLFAGTTEGVFRSTNFGELWNPLSLISVVSELVEVGPYILAYNPSYQYVYRSSDNGESWSYVSYFQYGAGEFVSDDNFVFASSGVIGVYISVNYGISWQPVSNGLDGRGVVALHFSGSTLFAGTDGGVYLSSDNGSNWIPSGLANRWVGELGGNNAYLLASVIYEGIFRSTDGGETWLHSSEGLANSEVVAIAKHGAGLFAGTTGDYVWRSSDAGNTWVKVDSGITDQFVLSLASIEERVFAGTVRGVYATTDSGSSWVSVSGGLPPREVDIRSLAGLGGYTFAGSREGEGVFRSSDNGMNWITANLGLPGLWINSLVVSDGYLFAGCLAGIGRTSNHGNIWEVVNNGIPPSLLEIYPMAVGNGELFAGSRYGGGVFRSTNNGTNWVQVNNGLTDLDISALATSDAYAFAATWGGGVFATSNSGADWFPLSEGIGTDYDILTLTTDEDYLFAGTSTGGVWRYPLSEVTAASPGSGRGIPLTVALLQNYPNPFNPTTAIRFEMGDVGFVSLRVYDLLGREVATLVNEKLSPGTYTRQWDATGQPSGVYFYRLSTNDFVQTRKLVLLR